MAICHVFCAESEVVSWHPCPDYPDVVDDPVAVFRFQLPEQTVLPTELLSLLQPDEISRAKRYHRAEDRQRFVYARGLLRILTGRCTHQRPEQVRFAKDAHGKPVLAGDTGWHMNVSHSGNWILLAVGNVRLGVDVERIQSPFAYSDMLPTSFSPAEQAYIRADADSRRRFYQLWTRKEALIKATGKGMDDDFFRIPALNGAHQTDSQVIGSTGDWQVMGFVISADYPGAVAYPAMVETPKFYTLESGLFVNLKS